MLTGIAILGGLALALAAVLLATARLLPERDDSLADRIESLLPRIQCGQCGYAGCAPYARAIADGTAEINRCPPGGESTVHELAELLGREAPPLDTSCGQASMDRVALIDETLCIGCNRCAEACPVDAIVGVHQMMHTVLADRCTGCELCLAPCPVDCIEMVPRHG